MAWMSEEQAAAALGVTFKTIRRRVGNGSLPSMRRGSDLLVNVEVTRVQEEVAGPQEQSTRSLEPIAPVVPVSDPSLRPFSPPRPTAMMPTLVPKMHLAAATLANAQPQPTVTNGLLPVTTPSRSKTRWMEMTIWVLLTLLLSSGTIGSWLLHETRQKLQQADNRSAQTLASVEQARVDGLRELTAFKTAATQRENKLAADLESARVRLTEVTAQVEKNNQAAADLSSALDLATSRLASMGSKNHELSSRLIITEAGLTALKWKADLVGLLGGLQTRLFETLATSSRSPVSPYAVTSNRHSALAESDQAEGTRDRQFPPAPPTLSKEDLAINLRPIVQQ